MDSIDKLRCKFYSDFKDFIIYCICNKPSLLNDFYNPFITQKEWEDWQNDLKNEIKELNSITNYHKNKSFWDKLKDLIL